MRMDPVKIKATVERMRKMNPDWISSIQSDHIAEEIAKVVKDKASLVVTYCANLKCPASHKLAEHLGKLGYTNVVEYPYGIEGWATAGNAVETVKK